MYTVRPKASSARRPTYAPGSRLPRPDSPTNTSRVGRAMWCSICCTTRCKREHSTKERIARVVQDTKWERVVYGR
jgi:hypothetical protein